MLTELSKSLMQAEEKLAQLDDAQLARLCKAAKDWFEYSDSLWESVAPPSGATREQMINAIMGCDPIYTDEGLFQFLQENGIVID